MTTEIEALRNLIAACSNDDCSVCDAATKAIANIERLTSENEALREALEFYGDEAAWNEPPVKTMNHEIFGKAYENQASKVRLDRGKIARAALSKKGEGHES